MKVISYLWIEKIYLCGISGRPPDKEIEKTALGATEIVPWEYYQSTVDCLKELKNKGYNVCALELTNQSKAYNADRKSVV